MKEYREEIKIIQKAMFKVVNEKKGTANKSKAKNFFFQEKLEHRKLKKLH